MPAYQAARLTAEDDGGTTESGGRTARGLTGATESSGETASTARDFTGGARAQTASHSGSANGLGPRLSR
eukprot:3454259-Amphidinium_carterae.1